MPIQSPTTCDARPAAPSQSGLTHAGGADVTCGCCARPSRRTGGIGVQCLDGLRLAARSSSLGTSALDHRLRPAVESRRLMAICHLLRERLARSAATGESGRARGRRRRRAEASCSGFVVESRLVSVFALWVDGHEGVALA